MIEPVVAGAIPNITMLIVALIVAVSIWEAVWKGIALWKSARNSQLVWFVCILVLNTAGILPIVYILFFQKKGVKRQDSTGRAAKRLRKA